MRHTVFELENKILELQSVCRSAIDTFGKDNQILQTCEELSELMQAISKARRYKDRAYIDNVAEEIADVLIMLAQIQMVFGISDYMIESEFERKQQKLKNIIKAERTKG